MRSLGEMAEPVEGAPLLREYGVKNSIEGSNPSLSAIIKGKVCIGGRPRCRAPAVSRHAPLRGMMSRRQTFAFRSRKGWRRAPGRFIIRAVLSVRSRKGIVGIAVAQVDQRPRALGNLPTLLAPSLIGWQETGQSVRKFGRSTTRP